MKRIQLAIVVKEQEYVKRLADYVRSSVYREQLQLIAFTKAEACAQYLKECCSIELLAGEPDLLDELRQLLAETGETSSYIAGNVSNAGAANSANSANSIRGIPTAALVQTLGQGSGYVELLQYQSLPLLLQALIELRMRVDGARSGPFSLSTVPGRGIAVIAVFSAVGGSGKTTLSLHMAHAASVLGKRVFYLNMERWNSSAVWMGDNEKAAGGAQQSESEGLSELLYCLKAQPGSALKWLVSHVKYDSWLKTSYIAPCSNPEDRLQLSAEDALSVIEAITASQQYDLIICDMDDELSLLQLALLEKADSVLWIAGRDVSAQRKQAAALHYGKQKWGERFLRICGKAQLVHNEGEPSHRFELEQRSFIPSAAASLPNVEAWRTAYQAPLLSSPAYRAAVDRLLKSLLGSRREGP